MDRKLERLILDLLRRHNLLRLATVRPDGWPQVTTVTYANEGLTLYVMVDKTSQKAKNIRKCDKVSLTIDRDTPDWDRIKGLSMGATAQILADRKQKAYGAALLAKKFPDMAQWASHAATRTSGYAQSGSCCAWAPRKRPRGGFFNSLLDLHAAFRDRHDSGARATARFRPPATAGAPPAAGTG